MVITILDAKVKESNWEILKETYNNETSKLPENIYQTFLIQSQEKPTLWRIMTHWRSQEDLDHMRQTTAVPTAVKVFNKAGAKPNLQVWNIETHRVNKNSS